MDATATTPLVFVAMPFGKKRDPKLAVEIDFDAIYGDAIKPAIADLGLAGIRADEEGSGGVIHLPMFERLLLAEYAIVDVTLENANVFYELGVRHAARPRSTIIVRAHHARLPFDINMMRAIGYTLEDGRLTAEAAQQLRAELVARLRYAADDVEGTDSPLFQLIPSFPGIDLPHAVTESFRDRARSVDAVREELAAARRDGAGGLPRVKAAEARIGPINEANAELAADLLLSYRDLRGYDEMIELYDRIPAAIRERTVTLREQYAFALNRRNRGTDRHLAIDVLEAVLGEHGDSPETCSLLARVYKDIFAEAKLRGENARATGHLARAIEYYRRGFDADWRDYYPGINLATLLAIDASPAAVAELQTVLQAVSFGVGRLGGLTSRDYWTVATVLEVAILGNDWSTAERALGRLFTLAQAPWMLETTTNNLTLLRSYQPGAIDLEHFDEVLAELRSALAPAQSP